MTLVGQLLRMLPNPIATLNHALSLAPAEGMALEFGVYSGKTLTEIVRSRKGVDIYPSPKTVLELVGPRLRPGSVVVFDEFFNYPGWQFGEYRAWGEHVDATGWKFSYEAFTIDNEQVAVRLTDVGSPVDIERFAPAPRAAAQHR